MITPKTKLILLDRDGTLIENVPYLADPDKVSLIPGAAEAVREFIRLGWTVALVSNQSGIGRGLLDEATLQAVNQRLIDLLKAHGVQLAGLYHCPDHPDRPSANRKPAPGMALQAARDFNADLKEAWVIGDSVVDIGLAEAIGARSILVLTGHGNKYDYTSGPKPTHICPSLTDIPTVIGSAGCPL
jgi:D-glycero-D-manno-heptose 1,7-bisphosphate phosphatase